MASLLVFVLLISVTIVSPNCNHPDIALSFLQYNLEIHEAAERSIRRCAFSTLVQSLTLSLCMKHCNVQGNCFAVYFENGICKICRYRTNLSADNTGMFDSNLRLHSDRMEFRGLICNGSSTPISSVQLSSSTAYSSQYNASKSCLNNSGEWLTISRSLNEWIRVQFISRKRIFKISTQGMYTINYYWIQSYRLYYELSDTTYGVANSQGQTVYFPGNTDATTVVTNFLSTDFKADAVKMKPISWQNYIALRWELYGYDVE